MTHTHDTLMLLCDAVTSYGNGTVGRTQARATLSAAIAEVLAERDANAKDAARYKFLAGKATQKTAYDIWGNGGFWSIGVHSADQYMNLYEVIDSAMKGTPT